MRWLPFNRIRFIHQKKVALSRPTVSSGALPLTLSWPIEPVFWRLSNTSRANLVASSETGSHVISLKLQLTAVEAAKSTLNEL